LKDDWIGFVAGAREGDQVAITALVNRFRQPLCASVFTLVKDWHLTQDIAQEAFAAAFRSLPDLREARRFRGWLFRIGRNHAVSRLRRRTRFRARSLAGVEEDEVVGQLKDGGCTLTDGRRDLEPPSLATLARVRRVVLALPNDYGAILVMRHMEGLTVEEIAMVIGRSPKGVKAILYRARALARQVLSRSGLDIDKVLNEM